MFLVLFCSQCFSALVCIVHSYLSRVGNWRQAGFSKPTLHRACFSASAWSISESEVGWPWVGMRHNYQQCFLPLFKALVWVVRYVSPHPWDAVWKTQMQEPSLTQICHWTENTGV